MRPGLIAGLGVALGLAACGANDKPDLVNPADRVFLNAAVYTVDEQRSWAEAVAIKDGKIVYVGDDEGAAPFIGAESEVMDLAGQMLLGWRWLRCATRGRVRPAAPGDGRRGCHSAKRLYRAGWHRR